MEKKILKFNFLIGALLSIALFSCTSGQIPLACKKSYMIAADSNIESEIAGVREGIDPDKPMPNDDRKYLHLAIMYSHYANSNPEYKLALESLEQYQEIVSDTEQKYFAIYLSGLINEVLKQKQNVRLFMKENKELEIKNSDLKKENQAMNEKISKLKYLDIRLEKKRIRTESGSY